MSQDYTSFRNSMIEEVNSATVAARAIGQKKEQKLRLGESDLPNLIPTGCEIIIKPTVFTKLRGGEVIYVRTGNGMAVRRFISLKRTASDSYLKVTREGLQKAELLPKSALIGRVDRVRHRGHCYEIGRDSFMTRLKNRLTEYGTHVPFWGWRKR